VKITSRWEPALYLELVMSEKEIQTFVDLLRDTLAQYPVKAEGIEAAAQRDIVRKVLSAIPVLPLEYSNREIEALRRSAREVKEAGADA
jgi:hypothetical protein